MIDMMTEFAGKCRLKCFCTIQYRTMHTHSVSYLRVLFLAAILPKTWVALVILILDCFLTWTSYWYRTKCCMFSLDNLPPYLDSCLFISVSFHLVQKSYLLQK